MSVERLLIVGTLGGGGIHRYIEEQQCRLAPHLDVSVYDMYSKPVGEGVVWFLRSLLLALVAATRFPFRTRPDVVHVHTSHRYSFVRASFYVLFAAHVWRRPVVLHVHGSGFDEFLEDGGVALRFLQARVFEASDAVVVLSPYWRKVLAEHVSSSKLHVLPNAVDPDEYDPTFEVDPPHVVFLSNLIERKGVPAFVEAVDALAERPLPGFEVSIAGAGPLSDAVEALAARHDWVTYHGYVSEAEKRSLLDEGSIYVLPTHAEGLPIAMLEAMAGGNAIVSTAVGAIPAVIDEGNGTLVEPRDPDGLADGLAELVRTSETIERMGRRNRRLVVERYAWDDVVDRLLSLYDGLAGGDGPDHGGTRPAEAANPAPDGGAEPDDESR
jgi:glycosyltransferase involved in cell wall biosynthesis